MGPVKGTRAAALARVALMGVACGSCGSGSSAPLDAPVSADHAEEDRPSPDERPAPSPDALPPAEVGGSDLARPDASDVPLDAARDVTRPSCGSDVTDEDCQHCGPVPASLRQPIPCVVCGGPDRARCCASYPSYGVCTCNPVGRPGEPDAGAWLWMTGACGSAGRS
jgi:hypothetical protein